jgi:DNA-binding transcriptional LysR family regulator
MLDGLLDGEYDIAFSTTSAFYNDPTDQQNLSCKEVTKIHRVIAYSKENVLAKKAELVPQDFDGQTLYSISNVMKPLAMEEYVLVCNKYGFNPRVRMVDEYPSLMMAVMANQGFAVTDEWTTQILIPGIAHLTLEDTLSVGVFWNDSNNNPAVLPFVDVCKKVFV